MYMIKCFSIKNKCFFIEYIFKDKEQNKGESSPKFFVEKHSVTKGHNMKIGLLGFGTIGTGFYEIINLGKSRFAENFDQAAVITKILDKDPNKTADPSDPHAMVVTDPDAIMKDPEIEIVVSLLGGMDFEYAMIKKALENKKHVVTASKAVISEYFEELVALAKANDVMLYYEAAVGGGIPIIGGLKEQLKINHINEIKGIFNGTTNFILSKMTSEGADFADTLKVAQEIGFAEADPTADIGGFDVSRKLAILSTLAYGGVIRDEDIYKRALSDVRAVDIDMAQSRGYNVKYLGHSKCINEDEVYTTVEPVLVPEVSVLGNVKSEFNIVSIVGDVVGELQFYGKGAGKDATAAAVAGDVLKIHAHLQTNTRQKTPDFDKVVKKCGIDAFSGKYYLRVDIDKNETLAYVLDLMDGLCEHLEVIISKNRAFFWTSEIKTAVINEVASQIKAKQPEVFYARIYQG